MEFLYMKSNRSLENGSLSNIDMLQANLLLYRSKITWERQKLRNQTGFARFLLFLSWERAKIAIEDGIAHNGSPVRKESNDMRDLEIEEGLGRQFTKDGKIPWRGVVLKFT